MPRTYSDQELAHAVSSVKRGQLTLSQASREFGIPRTTIHDHIKNPETTTKKGPEKQLTKTETDGLVNFIVHMAGQGFPMTRKMVRCYVQEICLASGREFLFNLDNGPSDKWFRKLKEDYPELGFRKPQTQDPGRRRMSNTKVASEFFAFWEKVLEEHGLTDKPAQIFNCDETGWSGKEASRSKVIAPKHGMVYHQNNLSADHMTAHLCVSGDGKFLPSMVIFKGNLPHRNYKDGLPGSWLFATSDSGYMDTDLFCSWFEDLFVPNCGRARPVVLLMDNHDAHISLKLVKKAREEQVILVGLPSHTTHYLQPLDVHIIGPIKDKVTAMATSVGFSKPNVSIGKARLPILVSHAIDQTTASSVKEAFRMAGIIPVNPSVITNIVPPTFTDPPGTSFDLGSTPTVTCEKCGQFVGQNPLVKRGLIPESLAEILIPPPVKPLSETRKRRIVSTGRVISGDEMLNLLKEREEREVRREDEKRKRQIERDSKREQKELEQEQRKAKKQKKDQERQEREQAKLKEKEERVRFGKLADKKYICGVCGERGRVNDEVCGRQWYGCDNDVCKSTGWYHFDCLSEGEKVVICESLTDSDVSWYCKVCFPRFYDEE